jgi:predicted DNA-binding transcriptional regulator AlpA
MASLERMLTAEEVAEILRISPKTLSNWRSKHKGPPSLRYGGIVLYSESRLTAWIDQNTEETDGQDTPRKMALSLRGRRARMDGKHRFGGYRTKQKRRPAGGGESPKVDIGRALAGIKN